MLDPCSAGGWLAGYGCVKIRGHHGRERQPVWTFDAGYDGPCCPLRVAMKAEQAYPRLETNEGGFFATWNWTAFFFGAIWYFVKRKRQRHLRAKR